MGVFMRSFHLFLAGVLCLTLAGCDSQAMLDEAAEKLAPEHIQELAAQVGEMVVSRDTEGIKGVLHPSAIGPDFDMAAANMWAQLPGGDLIDTSLAGVNTSSRWENGVSYTDYRFQYQYGFEEGWLHVQMVFREQDEAVSMINLHLTPLVGDLREINAFNLGQASFGKHMMFLAVIITPILIITTFVVAFRMRKSLKRPKRWLFFILIGVGGLTMNWTTGETVFEPLKFGLLGAGFLSPGPHAPLVLNLYFPLGMVLFWIFKQTGNLAMKEPDKSVEEILE